MLRPRGSTHCRRDSWPKKDLSYRKIIGCSSFNGIYRTNQSGQFNVPFAQPRSRNPRERSISNILLLRRGFSIERHWLTVTFESTLARVQRGDFVYVDPPYAVADRRIFAEYQADTFSTNDLQRLSVLRISKGALDQRLESAFGPSKLPMPSTEADVCGADLGITPYRNDTGHKPKDMKALIKRDQQLRTRFEDAVDLLGELIDATEALEGLTARLLCADAQRFKPTRPEAVELLQHPA